MRTFRSPPDVSGCPAPELGSHRVSERALRDTAILDNRYRDRDIGFWHSGRITAEPDQPDCGTLLDRAGTDVGKVGRWGLAIALKPPGAPS